VAGEEVVVGGDVFVADRVLLGDEVDDAVDQEEGKAVEKGGGWGGEKKTGVD
jgi:hypothetical protein